MISNIRIHAYRSRWAESKKQQSYELAFINTIVVLDFFVIAADGTRLPEGNACEIAKICQTKNDPADNSLHCPQPCPLILLNRGGRTI
jgi:hypothetical protein